MRQSVQRTPKLRSFSRFLSKITLVSMVIGGGTVSGYYAAHFMDRSESLIAKFASIQIKSKLPVTRKAVAPKPVNRSSLNKTNHFFFAKTDVMHASDAVLVAAQKSTGLDVQQTVVASKTEYIKPKPIIMASIAVPQPTTLMKPYPLPLKASHDTDPQKIIIEPASLNYGNNNDAGSATISLRASVSEPEPEKTELKAASVAPMTIAPIALTSPSMMAVKRYRETAKLKKMAAEKRCLAQAIYFEARSEPSLGQMAVANVVMNRVRSRHYPNSICGVVFQGQERRHKCQFSFACDGKTDRPKKNKHWRRAEQMAVQVMKGRKRIRALSNTLHYHADYVSPRWSRKMNRVKKIGRHIFFHDRSLKERI